MEDCSCENGNLMQPVENPLLNRLIMDLSKRRDQSLSTKKFIKSASLAAPRQHSAGKIARLGEMSQPPGAVDSFG
jgi:hypothetical protein